MKYTIHCEYDGHDYEETREVERPLDDYQLDALAMQYAGTFARVESLRRGRPVYLDEVYCGTNIWEERE